MFTRHERFLRLESLRFFICIFLEKLILRIQNILKTRFIPYPAAAAAAAAAATAVDVAAAAGFVCLEYVSEACPTIFKKYYL